MLAGKTYSQVRKLALSMLAFNEGGPFYTATKDLVSLGKRYNLTIDVRRRKFKSYEALPGKAILAINYREEADTWHWVVFHRTAHERYVLDPKKASNPAKEKI